jgi:hypothetical protein
MTTLIAGLRSLFLVALAITIGGFTFYSAVVIPILHDRLESAFETGLVTQRVTDVLNALAGITLLLGWSVFGVAAIRRDRVGRCHVWTLLISTTCLITLVVLHRVMDQKLATANLSGFYPCHRAYLWTSTVQWVANLALLIQTSDPFTLVRESRR